MYTDISYLKAHPAYQYAVDVSSGTRKAGKYVKLSCKIFLQDVENIENEDFQYFIDTEALKEIELALQVFVMPTGLKIGQPVSESLVGFQWLIILSAFCWKHKENPDKRRYEKIVLLVPRKNGKSFLVGLMFVILMILEPEYSQFFSVAPDRELSGIVKKELQQLIEKSPKASSLFKITQAQIEFLPKKSVFKALAFSESRLDGRLAVGFVADEVGALKNRYPIDSMESSQINMVNRLGVLISTAYDTLSNPMTEEVDHSARVLNGEISDPTLFSLLYTPDDQDNWRSVEQLEMSNPLIDFTESRDIDCDNASEVQQLKDSNLQYILKRRLTAINMPSTQKNFKTKHMNIFVDGSISDSYISDWMIDKQMTMTDLSSFKGKSGGLGIDFAEKNDHTGFSFMYVDDYGKKYGAVFGIVNKKIVLMNPDKSSIDLDICVENEELFIVGEEHHKTDKSLKYMLTLAERIGFKIEVIAYDPSGWPDTLEDELKEREIKWYPQYQEAKYQDKHVRSFASEMEDENIELVNSNLTRYYFKNTQIRTNAKGEHLIDKSHKDKKIDGTAALINIYRFFVEDGIKQKKREKTRKRNLFE